MNLRVAKLIFRTEFNFASSALMAACHCPKSCMKSGTSVESLQALVDASKDAAAP
jgi:hypothetical protein